MRDTLRHEDIDLADYVMRFGQWKGIPAPEKREVPSGMVREAVGFARAVKALHANMIQEERELREASEEALEGELLKNLGGDDNE